MNICLVINSKVLLPTIVFLNSLLINNSDSFNIYILNSELDNTEKAKLKGIVPDNSKITFIHIDELLFNNAPILWKTHSKEAYYKLLIPFVLPKDVEKVLYFDIDIVINGSIKELYDIDIDDYYLAACSDYFVNKQMKDYVYNLGIIGNKKYFNSGVVLFNLKKLRKNYKFEDAENYIEKNGKNFKYHDQEVLNALFNDKYLLIDSKYNSIAKYKNIIDFMKYKFFNSSKQDIVIHYAGRKPWKEDYVGKHFSIFLKYSKPVFQELNMSYIMENRRKRCIIIFLKTIKNVIFP